MNNGVEFTQYDEYEGRGILERTTLYFSIPEASDIRDRLFDEGYDDCPLFEYDNFPEKVRLVECKR